MHQMGEQQSVSQQLLFPEVLSVAPDEVALVEEIMPDLKQIGFDIERLDPKSFSINGVPSMLGDKDPITTLQSILHSVQTTGLNMRCEWQKQIALSLAKSTAIPYGKTLTKEEQEDLLTKLLALPNHRYTEDGKTIVSVLTDEELEKKF